MWRCQVHFLTMLEMHCLPLRIGFLIEIKPSVMWPLALFDTSGWRGIASKCARAWDNWGSNYFTSESLPFARVVNFETSCKCDEHNGHVLYTGSRVMDAMDICCTYHLFSLVILSLHSEESCHCLPRFYKCSVSTVYVNFFAWYIPLLYFALPFAISKEYFS